MHALWLTGIGIFCAVIGYLRMSYKLNGVKEIRPFTNAKVI